MNSKKDQAMQPQVPPSDHPFPMWNNQRTPESTALLSQRFVKTRVNPTEGMKEALL